MPPESGNVSTLVGASDTVARSATERGCPSPR